ncbi:MAG: gluconate:H+ symporter [Prolixibacteraceae bacterium]|nr:gluconate:H+ symporter [Prolixibacteraceae bacterium]
MPLLVVVLGLTILLLLIIIFKVNAFVAFTISSFIVGIAGGMQLTDVASSVQKGMGDTLGLLVMILGFGAMLGKLVADSGAAQRITTKLIGFFGKKYIQWAVVITGFIVGIPMFFSIGFVVLIPLLFTIAVSAGVPLLYVGIPMLASLSITHGLLPPHPAPTALAVMFDADIGKTLIYGIIISVPAIIIAGPLFAGRLKGINAQPLKEFVNPEILADDEMPGIRNSILSTLLPVILIGSSSLATIILPEGDKIRVMFNAIGDPVIAMLISLIVAVFSLGLARGRIMKDIMDSLGQSIASITMILLIIAGAGGFKEVLVETGISDYIAGLLSRTEMSPLILGWLISAFLRICVGSATVAGLTTAGIVLPLVTGGLVNKELMLLAIGSGTLIFSHVNDGAFWMVKEYFSLSVKETFCTWTVMETLLSVIGLLGVLLLNLFI